MPDVFVSYAHVDNERVSGSDRGWIDWFFETFNTKLRQLCGPKVQVWRDHKIDGSDVLTPTIEEAVRGTRIFVSVLSPSYLESTWCRTELRLFAEAAEALGGLRVGTKSRILKVLKTPVDRSVEATAEPDISDVIGYPFFRQRDNGRHWEYDPQFGQEPREEFYRQVYEVALDAKALLGSLLGEQPAQNVLVKPTGVVIYVAEPGGDMAGDTERLRRELRQFGHTVLPEVPYGYGADYVERVRADLARAQIVVHPVSSSLGAMPESFERRVVALQYDLAAAAAAGGDGLMRLVWMPPGAKIEAIADEALRDALNADETVRVCTLETVKSAITALVQRLLAPAAPPPESSVASGERLQLYLVFDGDDADRARPVADFLFAQGFAVTLPLFEGDENERRDDHDESLRECDAILILQASATDLWRRAKLRDTRRAFGNGRRRPFLARGLLLADTAAAGAGDTLDPDLIVLRASEGPLSATLAPFLDALRRSKGAAG